ncbi:MAG: AMP-binding protein, partial [Bacteroidota bacterium]
LQYPIALFGALRAGLVVVNTNPLYTPREMKHQFNDAGVKAVVIAENFCANLEKVLAETSVKAIITTSIGEMLGFLKGNMVNFVVRNVKRMVPKYNLPNVVIFKEALSQGKKFSLTNHGGQPEDVILLQYTGGTTGVSKGAMLTNRNLLANMAQIHAAIAPFVEEGKEIALSPLPMYHIFAFSVNCLALMSIGTLTVLIVNPRDLSTIVKAWRNYPITIMTGVNTLFNALLNDKDFLTLDFSTLKAGIGGGMAVKRSVAEKWQEVTGTYLSEGYGLTETSPVATINPLDASGRLGTIGMPAPSTDMRIVDTEGNPVPAGMEGEIQIKGPQVMKGYYNRPDETAKVFRGDWLCTGDVGKMSEDGYFQIVDRKKDMILVSGFNVFPNEVEEVIAAHDKVMDVAAIGVPHEKSGEVVKVFIVKKDSSLNKEEVIAYCKENLTGYKVPKEIEFRDDLPKSNVGKILRRVLRDEELKKRGA